MTTTPSLYRPLSGLDLLHRAAHDARERGRVVLESLARIEEIDPAIRAMACVTRRDTALIHAEAASGPLAGLPVAVKDIFDTSEFVTSYGSPIYAGHRPRADAAIVTLLKRNGAVIAGKAVTCEFAYMTPSATRNPCDLTRTAGGSSSGSAAAVAAGLVPFAIGSQTGGSTIRPASFCGIAGFKPTFGVLPTVGMKCFSWSFDTVGLFAASVRDVAYLAQVLIGQHAGQHAGQHVGQLKDPRAGSEDAGASPVFGVPQDYPWGEPSENASRVLERAIDALERNGARVRRLRFDPWMAELTAAHHTIQSYEAWQSLGFEYDTHREKLSPMLADFLARAASIEAAAYAEARKRAAEAQAKLAGLFDGVTALLTPGAPDEAPEGFGSTGDPAFNRNWTLLGCPCVSVPGLRGARGGPIGIQVIGRPWADRSCLDAAAFVERAIAGAPARQENL